MQAQTSHVTPDIFSLCGLPPAAEFIETSCCIAVMDRNAVPDEQSVLLISFCGLTFYVRLCGEAGITEDGEAIEGEAAEEVEVLGRVTYFINSALQDDRVV
ncbi:TPA: hypothetical protein RMM45_004237 [Escherichia coli]|nr:hypothetical protein [Escherichia coli]